MCVLRMAGALFLYWFEARLDTCIRFNESPSHNLDKKSQESGPNNLLCTSLLKNTEKSFTLADLNVASQRAQKSYESSHEESLQE